MNRQEFEKRVAAIVNDHAKDAVMAVLSDDTHEVHSGISRGKATISVWLDSDGIPMMNDTARGWRQNLVAGSIAEISAVLDEEESIGVVEYREGKRNIQANI